MGRFFQSQMCILLEKYVPSQSEVDQWKSITVYKAPPSCDEVAPIPVTEEELTSLGWEKIIVGKHPDYKHHLKLNGLSGIREQYALRHKIALTIHSIMGSTVPSIVIEISLANGKQLWEAAQVVVLLSRTCHAKDIYFIGTTREEVLEAIWYALITRDQFTDYLQHLLDSLCSLLLIILKFATIITHSDRETLKSLHKTSFVAISLYPSKTLISHTLVNPKTCDED
jgi:hypothetical protein